MAAKPSQVAFVGYSTLLNLVRFVAPIIFFSTKYLFGNESLVGTLPLLGAFSAAPEGWDWAVTIDFTCGSTCAFLVYCMFCHPSPKVWAVATAWTAYSCLDMVNAVQLSFVMPDDMNSPFPRSFFSFKLLGVSALAFKMWCSLLIGCQVASIYLLLNHAACTKWFLVPGAAGAKKER